jgi:O-acetyl-ADP-ribose deacetylase (regulator of RNase III)
MSINKKERHSMSVNQLEKISVRQGDITKVEVDIIVNAANTALLGGGGVDGAIHRAAGPELLAECKSVGGCPTGEARITRAYRLPAEYTVHTVGPIYHGRPHDAEMLKSCYESCLDLAGQYHVRSIAFPAISCGVYRYPIEAACKIAVDTCLKILESHPSLERVVFVLFSERDYGVYEDYIASLRRQGMAGSN